MITDLSPILHHVTPAVRTDELQLKKGSWVKFSSMFPNDQKTGWALGGTFVVSKDTLVVDYPVSNIIDNQDYVTLDLTNQTNPTIPGVPHPTAAQQGTLQMYPVNPYIVYQISVGMKRGSYFTLLSIPRGTIPIYQMGSAAIPPSINDPVYRYLGAKYPQDSPVDSPTWFLYTLMNAPQIVLQLFMDGGDTEAAGILYGKATIVFRVNKCQLQNISLGSIVALALPIPPNTTITITNGQVAVVTGGQRGDTRITGPQGSISAIPNQQVSLAPAGYTVSTGSGSAVITTMDDVRKWQNIQDRALYIPYYTELTNF